MPRPHEQRPSKLRDAAFRPSDDADAYVGGCSRERLIAMDARYCEVMRAALIKDSVPGTHPHLPGLCEVRTPDTHFASVIGPVDHRVVRHVAVAAAEE